MNRAALLLVLLAACTQQKVPDEVAEPAPAGPPIPAALATATGNSPGSPETAEGDPPVHAHTNRLAQESSPYLLQHKHNPVDWYPWGEEAFAKAKEEDKPIFLSIGYATCHWCHVMEHESFENEEVAAIMNAGFVCIKVDREERPDVDAIYMNAIQAVGQGGGWPLSAFLTHDRKPFYLGTYFPPEDRYGRPGFKTLLGRITEVWQTRRADLQREADKIIDAVKQNNTARGGAELNEDTLKLGATQFSSEFDDQWGGFNRGRAPKFPRSFALSFLLRQRNRGDAGRLLQVVEKTLEQMRLGGLQDQLGGGFHRYSTDREWLLPHFEKMLYDQAFLARSYLDAFVVTGKPEYEATARGIFTYVLRDLQDEAGGFHSAEDADSEGVEGKFYVWTRAELLELLGEEDGTLFADVYRATDEGNFKEEAGGHATGDNILHLRQSLPEHAKERGAEPAAFAKRIAGMREKLLAVRAKRVRPSLDDKVLTDWNGMMISAFARGGAVLDEPGYTQAAERAATFLLETMRPKKGTLLHRFRKGDAGIPAFLEDYAFLTIGLVDLYEATLDARWLAAAHELAGEMLTKFRDVEGGGFVLASAEGEELVAETKELYDGAIPSGNSAAALALLRVGRPTMDEKVTAEARGSLAAWSGLLSRAPYMYPYSMMALDLDVGPAQEIVIAGDPDDAGTRALLHEVRRRFLPRAALILHPPGDAGAAIRKLVPFVENQGQVDGKATAYVCENYSCKAPVTTAEALAALLDEIAAK